MRLKHFEHRHRVFIICVTGIFITVFDTSSSIVALPTITADFGTHLPIAQWVVLANSLTIAALLVPMGRLSDLIGRKRIYVIGCCLFAGGAAVATLSPSIFSLIGARTLVGTGSAMTQGTAMAILIGNFEIHERARVLGLQMGAVGLGAIAGPAAGGLIVGTIGWRMLFAITAFTMVLIAVSAQRILRRRKRRPDTDEPGFDFAGAVLFSSLLVLGLLTLTLGPGRGWLARSTLIGAALFVILLGAFIAVERRHAAPMLDFGLFRNGAFALGAVGAVVAFMCISSMRFLAPFFLQGVKGFGPSSVGLLMMPAALVTAVAAPFVGRMADRFGVRLFANAGLAVALAGLLFFAGLEPDAPTWVVVVGLMVIALGMATFGAPNSTSILNAVESSAHGVAAGFVNLCRNTGNVIGVAFGTAVVTLTMGAAGYSASLSDVGRTADLSVFAAFTRGINVTGLVLLSVALPVWVVLIVWTRRDSRQQPV